MPEAKSIKQLESLREKLSARRVRAGRCVTVSGGTCGQASGSGEVLEAFKAALAAAKLSRRVGLRSTGCHGFCQQEPIVLVEPEGYFYTHVQPQDVKEIIARTLRKGQPVERLLYKDAKTGVRFARESEIPFYQAQDRTLLSANRLVDPCRIEDYVAIGGYSALAKVLGGMRPEAVIAELKASGLRGRGGAGYPTGNKWEQCRQAAGDEKFVVCNADEGDPGAYMDRSLLEGNPHSVLEGMIIGAFAIGAHQGYIYVRREYPLAVVNARLAIRQARKLGLLGKNILGSGFGFDAHVARGAGAFVCGESTALMASLEGKVGEPRAKDVHTVEKGLWEKPTNLNNVETWANVPPIINHGAAAFAAKGTAGSKGTKIFALTGQVANTGLVEIPMGTSLRRIVYEIGGGPNNGVGIKAVQTGGPSGGCLPLSQFDLSVDYETLAQAGSMVGSGGMVVMDEHTCMVDVAKYFLTFLQDESCGKCVPCRLGIARMLEIVTDITDGRGRPEQLELLEDLADTIAQASLCALGKTAPNPVLSTLRYFKDEYQAHIADRRCPAGVCKELTTYRINARACTGCSACRKACPVGAITGQAKEPHKIDPKTCTRCGSCRAACRFEAVRIA